MTKTAAMVAERKSHFFPFPLQNSSTLDSTLPARGSSPQTTPKPRTILAPSHLPTHRKKNMLTRVALAMADEVLVPFWVCCMFELFNFYGNIHNVKWFYWVVVARRSTDAGGTAIDFIMALFAAVDAFCSLGCAWCSALDFFDIFWATPQCSAVNDL